MEGVVLKKNSSSSCGCYDCNSCVSYGEIVVKTTTGKEKKVKYSHFGDMGQLKIGQIVKFSKIEDFYVVD
mgnify:CR=1 FL=1